MSPISQLHDWNRACPASSRREHVAVDADGGELCRRDLAVAPVDPCQRIVGGGLCALFADGSSVGTSSLDFCVVLLLVGWATLCRNSRS